MSVIKVDYGTVSGGGDLTFTDSGLSSLASWTATDDHKSMLIQLYRSASDPWVKQNGNNIEAFEKSSFSGRMWTFAVNNVKTGDVITADYTQLIWAAFIDD